MSSYPGVEQVAMNIPLYTPPTVRNAIYEVAFESLDVKELLKVGVGCEGSGILIDAGFSGCTITPHYLGVPIIHGVKRISVGGKLLTNYLKEQISFRQYDMREETWLVNDVKERLCRVSLNFGRELQKGVFNSRYELPEHGGVGRVLAPDEVGAQVL
jgi:actin-related protein